MAGFNLGGIDINGLRYADETTFANENNQDLQELVATANEKRKPYRMAMNIKETKYVVMSRRDQSKTFNICKQRIEN